LEVRLVDRNAGTVEFSWTPVSATFAEVVQAAGAVPLPPYIKRPADEADRERYQTVYSRQEGAVAAPTAGLHFTQSIIDQLADKGISRNFLTLHVSAGTFLPVKSENAMDHPMHEEQVVISKGSIEGLLQDDKSVVAVGTTAMRTLESVYWFGARLLKAANATFEIGSFEPYEQETSLPSRRDALTAVLDYMTDHDLPQLKGQTSIYIFPGYSFKVCNGLITNFHQPGSTLLLLVAAFTGPSWKDIYNQALANDYRFLSYGDSSLLLPG